MACTEQERNSWFLLLLAPVWDSVFGVDELYRRGEITVRQLAISGLLKKVAKEREKSEANTGKSFTDWMGHAIRKLLFFAIPFQAIWRTVHREKKGGKWTVRSTLNMAKPCKKEHASLANSLGGVHILHYEVDTSTPSVANISYFANLKKADDEKENEIAL